MDLKEINLLDEIAIEVMKVLAKEEMSREEEG